MSENLKSTIISLDDIKKDIKINLSNATKSFVIVGYNLKYVRDNNLYINDGYRDIWDFAESEFGLSKSSASRFMNINDKFSVEGNSPLLLEKYEDFSRSQLQEMLNIPDDKLEKINSNTTVAEIKKIKKVEKNIATSQMGSCTVTSKQEPVPKKPYYECAAYMKYQFSKGCKGCFYDKADCPYDRTRYFEELKRKEEQSIRYEILKEMCNAICKMSSYILEKNDYDMDTIKSLSRKDLEFSFGFGDDGAGHSKYMARCKSERYYVETFDEANKWTFEAGEVDQDIWNFNSRDWHNNHPVMTIDELDLSVSAYNALRKHDIGTVDGLCKHTEKELLEDWKIGSFYTKQIIEKLSKIGRSLKPDVIETVETEPEYIEPVIKAEETVVEEPESVSDEKSCSGCGYNTMSREEYFSEYPESVFPCDNCGAFDNWVPEIEVAKDEPEPVETVVADIIQTAPEKKNEPLFSEKYHMRELIKREEETLNGMRESWAKNNPDALRKHELMLLAYKGLLTDLEYPNPELKIIHKYQVDPYKEKDIFEMVPHQINTAWSFFDKKDYKSADFYLFNARKDLWENDIYEFDRHEPLRPKFHEGKVKQPELPILKNNDQRKEWADNYKAWGEWYYDEHIDCHYYKYEFPNGDRLVVEEYLNRNEYLGHDTIRSHYHLLQKHKPAYEKNKTFEQKYVHTESSMTEIIEYLKGLQKKGA